MLLLPDTLAAPNVIATETSTLFVHVHPSGNTLALAGHLDIPAHGLEPAPYA